MAGMRAVLNKNACRLVIPVGTFQIPGLPFRYRCRALVLDVVMS
jgi:hypothetical protein